MKVEFIVNTDINDGHQIWRCGQNLGPTKS